MSQAAIDDVAAQLAAEDIRITVAQAGEALMVTVDGTAWSRPHTWLVVFLAFLRSGYCVAIR